MKTNPNDPATAGNEYDHGQFNPGLTKREHFAAMAMQAFLPRRSEMMSWDEIDAATYASTVAADRLIEKLNETSTTN